MNKFEQFKKGCAPSKRSVQSQAHVALSAKQVLQAQRKGEGQLALILHVESDRKEAFAAFNGDVTVEVEGLQGPVVFQKHDHNLIWLSSQEDDTGFGSVFDLLYTEEFSDQVNGLDEIEDDVLRRKAAKKIRSVIPAKIGFDEPQPIEG